MGHLADVGGPHAAARSLGIELIEARDLPFRVGTNGDRVLLLWHPSGQIRNDRAWEGIAQWLLNRHGIAWSECSARRLGRFLQTRASQRIAS